MDAALPLWITTSSRWRKKFVERGSPVLAAILPPSSEEREMASGPQPPRVSIANGANLYMVARPLYLEILFVSATDAADPAAKEDWRRCDWASVSGQVKSQIRQRPWDHGMSVAPSGLFPSPRNKPGGSNSTGTSTLRNARAIASFASEWRRWRPALLRQESPWWPSTSTFVPQMHECVRTRGAPRRRPTAIRTSSSLRRRPMAIDGRACSQEPEPVAWT